MFTILLHSSKTMHEASRDAPPQQLPMFIDEATSIIGALTQLSADEIARVMKLSDQKAKETQRLLQAWQSTSKRALPAIDAFRGDIYSGLQAQQFTSADRDYANQTLYIVSGLYGILQALDNVYPYRLEMAYRLPVKHLANLYAFWGDRLASVLPPRTIINLSSLEYSKAVLPRIDPSTPIIRPRFLTQTKDETPKFVVVHAKIARGAYASWLIRHRIEDESRLHEFSELNYYYDQDLSSPSEPVFVCHEFGGIGLSVRGQS